jgi:hypothetical protein
MVDVVSVESWYWDINVEFSLEVLNSVIWDVVICYGNLVFLCNGFWNINIQLVMGKLKA